jgi:hypothetical protein
MTLEDVLRAPLPDRVDEVAERMRSIEKTLPRRDGVRAFTSLYRAVTEDVDKRVRPETFADAPFARWLDVVFANLYFRALRAHVLGPKRLRGPGLRSSRRGRGKVWPRSSSRSPA